MPAPASQVPQQPSSRPDAFLVEAAKNGDMAAFDELYARYQPPVYRQALRMLSDHHKAEDVAQETLLRCWRWLEKISEDESFNLGGWLHVVCANLCLDIIRRDKVLDELIDDIVPAKEDPRLNVDAMSDRMYVSEKSHDLTQSDRMLILLRDVHGMSYQQIADTLKLTRSAVASRMCRMRKNLRRRVARQVVLS